MKGRQRLSRGINPAAKPSGNDCVECLATGGWWFHLAHGSRLAREYGFPAVQFPRATQLIPDGALITIDAGAGVITIDAAPQAEQPTPHGPPQFMAEVRTTRRSSPGAP
jgi:hypothetical protein